LIIAAETVLEPADPLAAAEDANDAPLREDHVEGAVECLLLRLGSERAARPVDLLLIQVEMLMAKTSYPPWKMEPVVSVGSEANAIASPQRGWELRSAARLDEPGATNTRYGDPHIAER